jgi:uncharacterized protein YodC (DUF2158 family)
MPEDFKVGDVVQLNSGGPPMTVTASNRDGIDCAWFEGRQTKSGWFRPGTLRRVSSEPQQAIDEYDPLD